MANKIANRKVICDTLLEAAKTDKDIVVLCSDSRGSASLTPFFDQYPQQSVEVGIAEQDLVSIAAGMASCGKKAWAASPASFVTTRSYEQCKVDVSYSNTNVKLIGISGGVSYGALGMSHHSAQDIAAMSAIPNMRVYLPSDRFQTAELVRALVADNKPAYIRVGRNPVEDVYTEDECPFQMDRATWVRRGTDVTIVATGEMVRHAVDAADLLAEQHLGNGARHVLRQAARYRGRDRGRRGYARCRDRRGAQPLRRPGFHGRAGRGRALPASGQVPEPARRAGHHRHEPRGLCALRPDGRGNRQDGRRVPARRVTGM